MADLLEACDLHLDSCLEKIQQDKKSRLAHSYDSSRGFQCAVQTK
jgi:hypothetical protein